MKYRNSRRTHTIMDQLIVSGSNFATGVILVRGLGLEQFGRFTVAYALILLANNVQLSFISSPMISLGSLCSSMDARLSYVRGMFGIQVIFCILATLIGTLTAIAFLYLHPQPGGMRLLPAFIVGIALFLMQDWLRRYYFTIGKAKSSVWNDAVSYLLQAVVLAGLMYIHRLTLNSALWSIGITSGAAFVLGMMFERIRCSLEEVREAWRHSQKFSRDLAIANQLQWFVYQGAMLIGAGVLGAEAAGSVRATQNVVGPVNVAFQAMENLVPIKAGEEMRRGGIQQAAKFLFQFAIQGFVVLFVVFLGLSFFSREFLSFFYGHKVAVYAGILNLQMVYFLLAWPLRQFTYLFRTIEKTSSILMASIMAAVTSLLLIYPCVRSFNALGIMVAAVAGQLANLLYMSIVWMRMRPSVMEKQEHFVATVG